MKEPKEADKKSGSKKEMADKKSGNKKEMADEVIEDSPAHVKVYMSRHGMRSPSRSPRDEKRDTKPDAPSGRAKEDPPVEKVAE